MIKKIKILKSIRNSKAGGSLLPGLFSISGLTYWFVGSDVQFLVPGKFPFHHF